MDTLQKLEALEQQLTLLMDLVQNQDHIQTSGEALAYTFQNLAKQVREIKKDVK